MIEVAAETAGWLAAGFTLLAFSMHTMVPLRIVALFSNIFFIIWGALAGLYPPLVLHLLLLPFNGLRLWQILSIRREIADAQRGAVSAEVLLPLARRKRFEAGDVLFARGEEADYFYYIVRGSVRVAEFDIVLGPRDLVGEIAFFSLDRRRISTVVAQTDLVVLAVDEEALMRLYYQNPAFSFRMAEMVTMRLIENAKAVRAAGDHGDRHGGVQPDGGKETPSGGGAAPHGTAAERRPGPSPPAEPPSPGAVSHRPPHTRTSTDTPRGSVANGHETTKP